MRQPYGKLPSPLEREAKLALISKSRGGDKEAIDCLILAHLRLGISIVTSYVTRHVNNDADELLGVMHMALVEGMALFLKNTDHDEVTAYLKETIHSRISRSLEDRPAMRVPGSTRRTRKERKQEPITLPQKTSRSIVAFDAAHEDDGLADLEITEIIEKLCETDQERNILSLRLDGLSDNEIGLALGLSRHTINIIRQELQGRYRDGHESLGTKVRLDPQQPSRGGRDPSSVR